MNKKIISLCIILFLLIICTTVTAKDNSTNSITKENSISAQKVITQTHVSTTHATKTINKKSITNNTKTATAKQDVQNTSNQKNVILKRNKTLSDIKTASAVDKFNITGIVTTAYDKINNVYAAGEEDAFVVNGAKISLYDSVTGKSITSTKSDITGAYNFTNLNSGNYTLKFSYGTYSVGEETTNLISSRKINYIFIPDIAIITFSGDTSGNGQKEKANQLKKYSDRFFFLESYALNNSYDDSGQWMLDYSNFILVDMYSPGNGFAIDTSQIAKSPASKKEKIAYVFGIFDDGILQGTLGNWGFLGGNPHSVENTYVGSYWQTTAESNSTVLQKNMKNLFSYIKFLLKETTINPTTTGNGPIYVSNSWGIYYPGFKGNVKTPSESLINTWILSDPGYNADGAGSLNWMTIEYSQWNKVNNNPQKIFNNFEKWYNKNKKVSGPFVAIATYYSGGKVVNALIKEYENQKRAAFSIYKNTAEDPDMTALLEMAGNKSYLKRGVSAVSYMYWWTTGYTQRGEDYTINAYKHLNTTLINALKDISKFSYESEYGPQNEWTAAVTMPEFEGVYGSIPISYVDENQKTVLIKEGIAKHVQLTNGWAKLKELNNSKKRISLIVYGYPPGKANIGASFLDVFQTIHDFLEKLYDEGYNIGMDKSQIPTTEEINTIVTDFSNKGQWAEGLLDLYVIDHYEDLVKYKQLVSKAQYNKWFKTLPKSLQKSMYASWGKGMGNGSMIYREKVEVNRKQLKKWLKGLSKSLQSQFKHYWNKNKTKIIISKNSKRYVLNKTRFYQWYFALPSDLQKKFNQSNGFALANETRYKNQGYYLIPGVRFGNIFLSVQPVRGWDSQIDFHNSYLPPPQQYVAYYKYLSKVFKNHAIVHLGTHGTLEWLPGRTQGLQSADWPFQLIETPIVYPYIVSNPGEGMTAKERSFAQVITHMTPVSSSTSLYGDYVKLNDEITRYDSNKASGVKNNMEYYKKHIINLTTQLGYEKPDYLAFSESYKTYLISKKNGNKKDLAKSKKDLIKYATNLGFEKPKSSQFNKWLKKVKKYTDSDKAFEDWLAMIHQDIEGMSADKMNYGLHTIGYVWNSTEMISGVETIASSRTTILESIMNLYYPSINESYYKMIKDRSFNSKKKTINNVLTSIVTNLVEGYSVEKVAQSYGVYNESSNFYKDISEVKDIINKVNNNIEWESILNALSGGYVEPGLAADPSYSDVLPTGRAMYASDTTKMPSKSAWESAVESVDQLLSKYMIDMGEETFPETVGEIIWGTEVLRTEGISLAQFLYLLGVEPVWDNTGTVVGTEVIPLKKLTINVNGTVYQRPRIDVFATIVSNNPYWLTLLTESVYKVNALKESTKYNYVKKHYKEVKSLERLFGLPGAVLEGTGVSDMLNQAGLTLNTSNGVSSEIASVYESRIGHSWNIKDGKIVVKNDSAIFAYMLEHVDLIIQNLDSSWRYLDTDDYVDWYGGLLNAATVHGATPNTILLDIRDKNNVVTNTLGEEVKRETRTTLLNPQWMQGMASTVGGWNQMSQNFENLMKTMLTTQNYQESLTGKSVEVDSGGNNAGIIGNGLLKELAENLIDSPYMIIDAQYKSYSWQSMAGWLLTSDMYGYWTNDDQNLKKKLLQKYVDNANRYGVACCHHTCGNINLHDWIIKVGSSLGVKGLEEYSQIYASATKNPDAVYTESNSDATISTEGTGVVDAGEGINEYVNEGTTNEANAMAMAGAGASGLADSTNNNGDANSMASNNGGTGTGDSGSGTGNGDVGTGTGSGSGSGSGTGTVNNTNGKSGRNGTATNDGISSAGDIPSAGSSSAGGESGSTSGSQAVYEIIKKNIGKPPSPQSEISLGYILFVVLIAIIFFIGFTKPNVRIRK